MKYGQSLPKNVENQLDEYIKRIKAIKWFQVSPDIKREGVDKQVNIVLEAFGVKASIEYRSLKSTEDWDSAWEAARDAAWGAARSAAWGAARDSARNAARNAAWDAAWGAAWGAADVLVLNLSDYKDKYPNGSFINVVPLWEMGLYPCVVIDGKFVVYVPEENRNIPQLTGNQTSSPCTHCGK